MRKRIPKAGPEARVRSKQERADDWNRQEAKRRERRQQRKAEDQERTFVHHLLRSRVAWLVFAALIGGTAAVGFLHEKDDTLPAAPASDPAAPAAADRVPSPPEIKRHEYEVDGIKVQSDTVPEAEFRIAYEKAKILTGGLLWKPTKSLSVEYGLPIKSPIDPMVALDPRVRQHFPQKIDLSETNVDHGTIRISRSKHLAHELVHFLLGPEALRWPQTLQELIASAIDESDIEIPPEDLDQPWISLPAEKALIGDPLSIARYAAVRHLGKTHKDKIPSIIRAAFEKGNLSLEELEEFMAQFGIRHHILRSGKSGEFRALTSYQDGQSKGTLYVHYIRRAGDPTEIGVGGKIMLTFTDKTGQAFRMGPYDVFMTNLLPDPPTDAEIAHVHIEEL